MQDATLVRGAAEALAAAATPKLVNGMLLPCDPAAGEDACAQKFITTYGQRAFRRPVAADEATRLTSLYTAARTTLKLTFTDAIGVLIEAMLQTPQFLYHWEAAPTATNIHEGAVVRLGSYQIASRLSYFIWGSMPDDALLAAAAAGQLDTAAGVQTAAHGAALADPKAKETVSAFFADWMGLDGLAARTKDTNVYKTYTAATQQAMLDETSTFVQSVAFGGDGRLATLLGAPYSYINATLAPYYGAACTQASSTGMTKTALDPTQRGGPAPRRAASSRSRATPTCVEPRAARKVRLHEAALQVAAAAAGERSAARASLGGRHDAPALHGPRPERLRQGLPHGDGSHRLSAFEHYDGIGQYRTMDNGLPVDSSGSITLDGQALTFNDAIGLVGLLSKSSDVRACFAGEWSRFALSRVDTDADAASLQATATAFASDTATLQDLMAAVATMRSFRYRSPSPGEMQ